MGSKQSKIKTLDQFFDGEHCCGNDDFTAECADELVKLLKSSIVPSRLDEYSDYYRGIITCGSSRFIVEAVMWDEDFEQHIFLCHTRPTNVAA